MEYFARAGFREMGEDGILKMNVGNACVWS